jgi:hypothetical protein
MQTELESEYPGVAISILGVNEIGQGNSLSSDHYLPMLQDSSDYNVWTNWNVSYRDVYILDENNELYGVYNLSQNSISDTTSLEYDALKCMFVEAAGETCIEWDCSDLGDDDGDGLVDCDDSDCACSQ